MKQIQLLQTISDLLNQFSIEVKEKGKLSHYDINIVSEDVLVPILNIAFNTSLKNLNTDKKNFPGIDLATDGFNQYGDNSSRIAFQITSTNNVSKIKKTLNSYVKGEYYKNFDHLYIYNLTQKQDNYSQNSFIEIEKIIDGKFKFDLSTDIIDKSDLQNIIRSLTPIDKIEKIAKLLQNQFVYVKKSLLSLEIWESEGKIGYGFSNLLNSIDSTTYQEILSKGISSDAKDLLETLLARYNKDFSNNYANIKNDQFQNLGFNTYLKAAFLQSHQSFDVIKNKISGIININSFKTDISKIFEEQIEILDESDFPLVNNPISHPAIKFVKKTILQLFESIQINKDIQNEFLKNFNEKIPTTIIETFGIENYNKHLEKTKDNWLRENEKELLVYIRDLGKLGFIEDEKLKYQPAFGTWQDIRNYGSNNEDLHQYRQNKNDEESENLKPIESLINNYFDSYCNNKDSFLNNILFLIADFGKGKTSFLHHYSSNLAKQYLKTHEGVFPVYINLNEYDKYSNSPSLGLIANYLAQNFKIDIKEEYFKKKNYIFLIDSLDECGELSETHIDKVIKDINEIQNLDNINCRNNKIIIASRPIAKGLKEQIGKYQPYKIESKTEKSTISEISENFISVHGFINGQFNDYIEFALNNHLNITKKNKNNFTGISNQIIEKIILGKEVDLHTMLKNTGLKQSELRRPIFAYMIYKLIISNSNFIDFGKVGVYISFLNQLSRDAKHKDDINHKVSLKDEFVYRNILHSSALLWQYKRQSGEQTSLTKADICRTIEEKEIDKDDRKVLAEFKDIESIHFLSHSYLGEKENTLHFQHQSFAEILLAEYYLKTILKYSIEENTDVEEARVKLSIGLPTDQTVDFLKGLLILLKECISDNNNDKNIFAKRELFLPLLASMAINKHNKKLYSTRLNATWFEKYEEDIFRNNRISNEMINDFPITLKTLDKIDKLCQNIINSKKVYLLDEPSMHSVLYKNELTCLGNIHEQLFEIDKWFALLSGNHLINNVEQKKFFNSKLDADSLFKLIMIWSNKERTPEWTNDLFMGIDMSSNSETLYFNSPIYNINFSHSYLKYVLFSTSNIRNCNFSNCTFDRVSFEKSDLTGTLFDDIDIIQNTINLENSFRIDGNLSFTFCFFSQGLIFPEKLNNVLKGVNYGLINFGVEYCPINEAHDTFVEDYFFPLKGIFKHILLHDNTPEFIISAFKFIKTGSSKTEVTSSSIKFQNFIHSINDEIDTEKN